VPYMFTEKERERNQVDVSRQQLYESVVLLHACSPGPEQYSLAWVINEGVY